MSNIKSSEPAWVAGELPARLRWATMFRVALAMSLYDRQKTLAAVLGVAFAYLLVGQQISTASHYLDQSTAYIDGSRADLWILPPAEKAFFVGSTLISTAALHQARVTPGVDWAEPVVRGGAWVRLPDGGTQKLMLVGTSAPRLRGGPLNIVQGDDRALLSPDTVFIEDSARESLGGLNVGDTVELSGRRVHVAGLTWGLRTIIGPYAFTEYDFARSLLEIDSDRTSCILVGLSDPTRLLRVRDELRARIPDATIMTSEEYRKTTREFVLFEAGIIGIIAMGILIGLTVGLAIVTLAMLSAVQQNVREFGTLKAIGATNADLRRLLLFQALSNSLIGSFIGAATLCQIAAAARSPRLIMIVHPWLLGALVPFVTFISIVAAMLAIRRIQRLEPASVFR